MQRPTPNIEVTFKEHFPLHLVTSIFKDGFLGLCQATSVGEGPRILVLHPTPREYHVLTKQLRELESEGALTFVDTCAKSETLGRPAPDIEVTFKEHCDPEFIAVFQDSFMGLCASTTVGSIARILTLHPTPHEFDVLTLQLQELEEDGFLTFANVPRHAP